MSQMTKQKAHTQLTEAGHSPVDHVIRALIDASTLPEEPEYAPCPFCGSQPQIGVERASCSSYDHSISVFKEKWGKWNR